MLIFWITVSIILPINFRFTCVEFINTNNFVILIDNIFSDIIDSDIIPGNLTATISSHLPQFAIIPNMFANTTSNKSNIYEWDWGKFDRENFTLDYFSIDWGDLLKTDEVNVDNSIQMYLIKINIFVRYLCTSQKNL